MKKRTKKSKTPKSAAPSSPKGPFGITLNQDGTVTARDPAVTVKRSSGTRTTEVVRRKATTKERPMNGRNSPVRGIPDESPSSRWERNSAAEGDGSRLGRRRLVGNTFGQNRTIPAIPVLFSDAQVARTQTFSPSPRKPAEVVQSWRELGFTLDFQDFQPATFEQLSAAHEPSYVEGVLSGRVPNGFGSCDQIVSDSLPWTSGSMLAAARVALRNQLVAVSPTSGFHHADYNHGGGFCTFNGLMVAAMALIREGRRVGILDLDQHYGNGTDGIIHRLGLRATQIQHFTGGRSYHHASQALGFLKRLPGLVASFETCDVLLYQAGADPHISDPLGGWLTDWQLYERDRLVFQTAREIGLPVAWNLAGGYQNPLRKVLDIHDATMTAAAIVYME